LREKSQRSAVKGALPVTTRAEPGLALRAAATMAPENVSSATDRNDVSDHIGAGERYRAGSGRTAWSHQPTPHPSAFMAPGRWCVGVRAWWAREWGASNRNVDSARGGPR
jgi:hypothetical protein